MTSVAATLRPAATPPVLPHSIEAERSVVGGIILHPRAFVEVADQVSAEDFYHPAHKAIFQAMVELDEASKPIDALTVAEKMRSTDTFYKLRAFNDEGFFAELTSAVVTIENIAYHAKIVHENARARRVIETCQEIAARGCGDCGDVAEFIDDAEKALFEATQSRAGATYERIFGILGRTIKSIEKRYDRKQVITGVPSGFHKLDAMTQGFQPSELIIVAARPSMGKTSLAMNVVQTAAIEFGVPALVFSLEMSKESLVERLLASGSRIDSTRLRGGFLEQRDWIGLTKEAGRISPALIDIDDSAAPTMLDIRARARRWRADQSAFRCPDQHGMIVVDYLQLINDQRQKHESKNESIARVSGGLKALAKELRVPVVALSQLNRGPEGRTDKRPSMADLRESGAIEQDADVIAFIYRDEVYNKESTDKGVAEVIVGKQRNGPIGTVRLAFLNQYTRFENLSGDHE